LRRAEDLARLHDRVLSIPTRASRDQGRSLSTLDPFHSADYRQVEHAFQDLNVIYCELTALLVLVSSHRQLGDISRKSRFQTSRSASSSQVKHEGKLTLQAGLVRTYVTSLLLGEDSSGTQMSRPLTPTMYVALLPTIWALLSQPGENYTSTQGGAHSRTVFSAVLDHAIGTTSSSSVKALTVEFVARILLVSTLSRLYEIYHRLRR
jgi:pre-rRNA-processing protein IPI1